MIWLTMTALAQSPLTEQLEHPLPSGWDCEPEQCIRSATWLGTKGTASAQLDDEGTLESLTFTAMWTADKTLEGDDVLRTRVPKASAEKALERALNDHSRWDVVTKHPSAVQFERWGQTATIALWTEEQPGKEPKPPIFVFVYNLTHSSTEQ